MSAAFDAADELSREVLMGAEVRTWRDDGEEGEGPEFATLFQGTLLIACLCFSRSRCVTPISIFLLLTYFS